MKKFHSILFMVFFGVPVFGVLGSTVFAEVVGKSIAIINGDAIFLDEFEKNWEQLKQQRTRLAPNAKVNEDWEKTNRQRLLDQMIEEKLLLQQANRLKIKVPKRQLEEGIRQVKNRFKMIPPGTKPSKADYERDLTKVERKEFLKELRSQDISEKEFNGRIKDQLRVLRLTEDEIRGKISAPFEDSQSGGKPENRKLNPGYEKEAKKLFGEIKKKYEMADFKPDQESELDQMVVLIKSRFSERVRARHILIKTSRKDDFKTRSKALNKIKAIKRRIDKGQDFVELAKSESEGPSAKNGGDLGYFTKGQMVPEFEKSAFTLPVGGISNVVETEFGYHIIMVEEKKAASRLRYDDIKFDLAGYLYQKRGQEKYDSYITDLRKKADVKILVNVVKSTDG